MQLNSLKEKFTDIDAEFIEGIFISVEYDYPSAKEIIEESLKEHKLEIEEQKDPVVNHTPIPPVANSETNKSVNLL
jgi:hypothetical protein